MRRPHSAEFRQAQPYLRAGQRGRFGGHERRLRFEPLEDRRMLSGTVGSTFAQVSRITGEEVTLLTADNAGHFYIYYHPNDELGYVDPETGDLLTADYLPNTSTVLVLTAVPSGNMSQLVGSQYSNGQPIAADGGNTVYHRDGSIMRSGGVWTYDAGATLETGGDWFWSNGAPMAAGATFQYPNGANLFSGGSLFYEGGGRSQIAPTRCLSGAQPLRNATGDYFYAAGGSLLAASTIRYANGVVMADSSGNVYNDTGTLSFTPFSRDVNIGNNEYSTHVENGRSDTIVGIENDVGADFCTYVSSVQIVYQALPPTPIDIAVSCADAGSLHFSWTSGGGSTAGYRVAVAMGVSPPGDPDAGSDTTDSFYDVTALAAGEKVSIRVWANDGPAIYRQAFSRPARRAASSSRPKRNS